MPKLLLRKQMLFLRRSLTHEEWSVSSRLAQNNLLSMQEYLATSCIALYAPIQNEIDTADILVTSFESNKLVLYPVVSGRIMMLRQLKCGDNLIINEYGIPEPAPTGADLFADVAELIVVPGVVFDQAGHRIGFGKGYYDRFLDHPARKALLLGLCHDFQVTDDNIPAERHDIRMDFVITDKRIIRCGSNRCRIPGPDSYRGGY
jgi:5-formyltetrahydrofolate cyclo-ligase